MDREEMRSDFRCAVVTASPLESGRRIGIKEPPTPNMGSTRLPAAFQSLEASFSPFLDRDFESAFDVSIEVGSIGPSSRIATWRWLFIFFLGTGVAGSEGRVLVPRGVGH